MQELTKRQKAVFDFIVKRLSETGICPSIKEIGAATGLTSTSSVQLNLDNLERLGYIERDPRRKRSIRVKGWKGSTRMIPLVGNIAAGNPLFAEDQIEEYIAFEGNSSSEKEYFALRVQGDSMINAGIRSGDIAIIEKTPYAENGDIVVALIDDSATLKTFYKENGVYRLQPENPEYEPYILDTVVILGKIAELRRAYSYRV